MCAFFVSCLLSFVLGGALFVVGTVLLVAGSVCDSAAGAFGRNPVGLCCAGFSFLLKGGGHVSLTVGNAVFSADVRMRRRDDESLAQPVVEYDHGLYAALLPTHL